MGNNELKKNHQWKVITIVGLITIILGILLNCVSCGKVDNTSDNNYGYLTIRHRNYVGGIVDTEYGRWVSQREEVKQGLNIFLRKDFDLTLNVTEITDDCILISFSNPIYQIDIGKTVDSVTLTKGTIVSFVTGDTVGLEVELEYED